MRRRLIQAQKQSTTIVLAPEHPQARQVHQLLVDDLNSTAKNGNIEVRLAAKQSLVDSLINAKQGRQTHTIVVTTPRAIQHVIGRDSKSILSSADLVLAIDLHNLTADYEYAIACLHPSQSTSPRLVGFAAPLLDARSLASWLGVDAVHTYSFQPTARPYPVITSFTNFNLPSSPGLLKAMVRPAYEAMRSNLGSTICFVPHRSQCYTTLADLLTASATDMNKLVEMDEELLAQYAMRISDPKIAEGIEHGFAIYNESMSPADQVLVRHLFNTHAIRALIASRDSCHSLEMTANLVIVMSTQYAIYDRQTDERQIVDYPLDDLLCMQAIPAEHQEKQDSTSSPAIAQCMIFTQPDKASLISKFLNEGLPLESSLLGSETLFQAILTRIASSVIDSKQRCLDAICTTFLAERVQVNPFYYGREPSTRKGKPESKNERLSAMVDEILEELRSRLLIRFDNEDSTTMKITPFGKAVSQNRITQIQIDDLFRVKESTASKMLDTDAIKTMTDTVSMSELQAFIKRLPRSIQRNILPQTPKAPAKSEKNAEGARGEGAEEEAAMQINATKALLLTFLGKKLPSAGSKLEITQARVAVALLEKLAKATPPRK